MAVTTNVLESVGMGEVENGSYNYPGAKVVKFAVAFDASYPADGEDIGLVGAGCTFENGVYLVSLAPLSDDGLYIPKYDYENDKILLYAVGYDGSEAGAAVATFDEVTAATDVHDTVVSGVAIGY